jgi:hypothetical protein
VQDGAARSVTIQNVPRVDVGLGGHLMRSPGGR